MKYNFLLHVVTNNDSHSCCICCIDWYMFVSHTQCIGRYVIPGWVSQLMSVACKGTFTSCLSYRPATRKQLVETANSLL